MSMNNIEVAVIEGRGLKVISIMSYILFSKVHQKAIFLIPLIVLLHISK